MSAQTYAPAGNPFSYPGQPEALARRLYDNFQRRGLWSRLKRMCGRDQAPQLQTMPATWPSARTVSLGPATVKRVAISQIRGTSAEGRGRDFDGDFRPLQQHNRGRWLGIAAARIGGRRLEPVRLVQMDDNYFVVDGHHRISVASALGQQDIEAAVVAAPGRSAPDGADAGQTRGPGGDLLWQPAAT